MLDAQNPEMEGYKFHLCSSIRIQVVEALGRACQRLELGLSLERPLLDFSIRFVYLYRMNWMSLSYINFDYECVLHVLLKYYICRLWTRKLRWNLRRKLGSIDWKSVIFSTVSLHTGKTFPTYSTLSFSERLYNSSRVEKEHEKKLLNSPEPFVNSTVNSTGVEHFETLSLDILSLY